MNPANLLTVARVVVVPVFVVLMFLDRGAPGGSLTGWAIALFVVAAFTDLVDGYIARRWSMVTRLGEFLDPLADKMLVGAALVTLVAYRRFPLWAALVIALREVVVSIFRSRALKRGRSMPASLSGKIKTAVQTPMVVLWLLPRAGAMVVVQDVAMYLAVAFTVLSGFRFMVRYRQAEVVS